LYEDPTVYSPEDVLRQATIDGAIAMGLNEVTGSITPGKRADLIIVRANDLNMGPFIDPVTHIVFSAQPRNVEAVSSMVSVRSATTNWSTWTCRRSCGRPAML
jgi:cytosine/adenosine deaminase-related metal-dependent hydrolase